MELIHIINGLGKGGAEKLLTETLPLYRKAGHKVTLVQITSEGANPEYVQKLEQAGVEVCTLGSGNIYSPLHIPALRRFLKGKFPDIIHVHLFPAMYWVSLAFRALKREVRPVLVFTEHSNHNKRLDNKLFKPIDRLIYKSYSAIIAISGAIQTKLQTWTGTPQKIRLIRNGVDVERITGADVYNRAVLLQEFGIPEQATVCLMTARFQFPKDHLTVMKSMLLSEDTVHLVFAGEGSEKPAMEAWVKAHKMEQRIHFAGFRADIPSLMKSVDINILSSAYEGMSGVTLEAFAAGKPFLGSDVAGINDIVPDNRFLFEAGNDTALAAAIRKIKEDDALKADMSREGVSFAKQFDVAIMIEEHIALYQQLISDRKTAAPGVL